MMADPGPLRTKFLCKITGRTAEESFSVQNLHGAWARRTGRRTAGKIFKGNDKCV